jgi:hypothetical protein
MFVQIIRGRVTDPDSLQPAVDRWMTELAPQAVGWLGSTSGVTDDNQLFVMARFESEEAAKANSGRPEQDRWWAQMEKMVDGVTFQDSTDVQVETSGDPDSATFVQVMTGQTNDPDRARQLMSQDQPDMRSFRPDILGSVTVGHEDGKWTMVNYFTSEAQAREGERKQPPPEMQKAMEEMMALSVGQPEFLDLKTPRLDSPQ